MSKESAFIAGSGEAGILTGLQLQQLGFEVTALESNQKPYTENPSFRAGASVWPYRGGGFSDERITWLVDQTLTTYEERIDTGNGDGLRRDRVWRVSDEELDPTEMPWLAVMGEPVEFHNEEDIPGNFKHALLVPRSVFVTPPIFYPDIREEFVQNGGKIEQIDPIQNWDEFLTETVPNETKVVVNAMGLGARELIEGEEHNMMPLVGTILRANMPERLSTSIPNGEDTLYGEVMYVFSRPERGEMILGGTQIENGAILPNSNDYEKVFAHAKRVMPGLSHEDILEAYTCSRPYRKTGPRIESELKHGKLVIHNYGHGGSGFTIGPGAAMLAASHARPREFTIPAQVIEG